MQKNLKVRLIQNIPETELETEFESESGIFLSDGESAFSELGGLQEI